MQKILGRYDRVDLPQLDLKNIHAKIDTGAFTSSLHCQRAGIVDGKLEFVLLDEEHPEFTGMKFTFSDFEVTTSLVKNVARLNPSAVIICHADNKEEAVQLYDLGATYVMIPHFIGSEKISAFIKKSGLKKSEFINFKDKHLTYLENHFPISE